MNDLRTIRLTVRTLITGIFFCTFLTLSANAHLMVAQHGTMKFGKGGFFFVLSIPVSTFQDFDDDGDGFLSSIELSTHVKAIEKAIHTGFILESDQEGQRKIEGLVLNLAHDQNHVQQPVSHIVALGRFSVNQEDHQLTLRTTLFGKKPNEQHFELTFTRGESTEVVTLSKNQPSHSLFAK